jgi:hypothetical protein
MRIPAIALCCFVIISCSCGKAGSQINEETNSHSNEVSENLINKKGMTIEERFLLPEGYERIKVNEYSFSGYLRKLPLKPHNTPVRLFNGNLKSNQNVHMAVVDMDIGNRDLHQCADAVIRLRAEYLYQMQEYDKIHFNFTSGFRVDYAKWIQGYRVAVDGNRSYWKKSVSPSNTNDDFRDYLNLIYTYAGTLSLSKELKNKEYKDIFPGDIFIQAGSPGHAVIVIDLAINKTTGKKIYMLAQSYMPAQEIHILKNPEKDNSPWYELNPDNRVIETPEWTFYSHDLKRFEEE